ncbi:TPA: transcriptional regulator, partial [Streptococcus suis]
QLARDYGVSEKSIQRDFSFLDFFLEGQPYFSGELRYISRERQRYLYRKSRFSKQEILVVTKILLENRAFNVKENGYIEYDN